MPTLRPLTTAALALILASTAVACGGNGGTAVTGSAESGAGAGPGADGNRRSAVTGLVEAADMDTVVKLVHSATECQDVTRDPEENVADFDHADGGGGDAGFAATNKDFSIKDRASCHGESSIDNNHKLLLIDDMAVFQAAYKAFQRSDGDTHTRYYVGRNFAVELNARSGDREDFVRAGSLGINCSPNFAPPPGYRSEPALVDGCLLTDYVG